MCWRFPHSPFIAEEVTQKIFIKLWLCRDMLGGVHNLDGYIFAIARNKTLNYREIASRLHISPYAVKNHLLVALKFIRKYLSILNTFLVFLLPFARS